MTAEIFISSDMKAQAWRLYSETRTPLEEIAKLIGIKPCTFLRRRKIWGWPSRAELRMKEVPAAAKRIVEQARPKVDHAALIARIRETVEREIAEIDHSLRALDGAIGASGLERSARTLATLVKTLTELKKLREADKGPAAEEAYERPDMDESADPLRAVLKRLLTLGTPAEVVAAMTPEDWALLGEDWPTFGRDEQRPPPGDWSVWLFIGGRGAGKTRAGAEWVSALACGDREFTSEPVGGIALIGETAADVREVMVEGVSGILALGGRERPLWEPSRKRLTWPNGAVAQCFSAEDPEALRGPQFGAAWCDELGKWKRAEEVWDMLQFGLRLGTAPRQMVTTTPRPIPLLKKLMADPRTAVTHATTRANAFHLAPSFLETVMGRYGGTRLGRQELEGEIIEDRADALWSRAMIEAARVDDVPELGRIVVAVDPPAGGGRRSDACGIVVAGRAKDGMVYVLEDATIEGSRPDLWAAKAVAAWKRHEADALVAEANQGGAMVRSVISQADAGVPVTLVHATRGKWLRAEPVANLYAQGRVRHVGPLPELEDEMCDFGLDGLSSGRSPDRLDALVWAVTSLVLSGWGEPRVRGL